MKRKVKSKNKTPLLISVAIIVIAVLGFGGWYLFSQSTDSYPTLDDGSAGLQGKSVESEFGYLEFDNEDVNSSSLVENSLKMANQGINKFYSAENLTIAEIIENIQPKNGLKVLIAYYSSGGKYEKGFHTYPVGPYESHEITSPEDFEIPAYSGFFILSNSDHQYNSEILKDVTVPAEYFDIPLMYYPDGWKLLPITSAEDLNRQEIELAFVANKDGIFKKINDLNNPILDGGYIAWLKLKNPPTYVPPADDETEDENPDPGPVEDATFQPGAITNNLKFTVNPGVLATLNENTESTGDAFIKSITYLNSVESASSLINVPSVTFPDYLTGEFINSDSLNDSGVNNFMMSAVELEVGGTSGTIDLNTVEYSTFSQRRNKIGSKWFSWKDSSTDSKCLGAHRFLYVLTNDNGVFKNVLLAKDQNKNKIFSMDSESDNFESTKLEAGKKYVFLITMEGMDACAKKFNWEAPLQVKAHVRTDFKNIQFFSEKDGLVNINGSNDADPEVSSIINRSAEDRWVNFIDKSPYN